MKYFNSDEYTVVPVQNPESLFKYIEEYVTASALHDDFEAKRIREIIRKELGLSNGNEDRKTFLSRGSTPYED